MRPLGKVRDDIITVFANGLTAKFESVDEAIDFAMRRAGRTPEPGPVPVRGLPEKAKGGKPDGAVFAEYLRRRRSDPGATKSDIVAAMEKEVGLDSPQLRPTDGET